MKRELLIFLGVVVVAAAMVPRLRRAVNLDEQIAKSSPSPKKEICKPETPCAWSIYTNRQKVLETNIDNSYCKCAHGTKCQVDEDDENLSAFIYHCKEPGHTVDKDKS